MDYGIKNEFFVCGCGSDEHTLRFIYIGTDGGKYDDMPDLYTSVFLNDYRSFFKRLLVGIKYIFGYKCKYGHWDTFTLAGVEDAKRLRDTLDLYIKETEEWNAQLRANHLKKQ